MFLDLAGFEGRDPVARAHAMRARVQQWTTIPTCVGIAETKTLAKLANAAAKKDVRFGGVADLRDEGYARHQDQYRARALEAELNWENGLLSPEDR